MASLGVVSVVSFAVPGEETTHSPGQRYRLQVGHYQNKLPSMPANVSFALRRGVGLLVRQPASLSVDSVADVDVDDRLERGQLAAEHTQRPVATSTGRVHG